MSCAAHLILSIFAIIFTSTNAHVVLHTYYMTYDKCKGSVQEEVTLSDVDAIECVRKCTHTTNCAGVTMTDKCVLKLSPPQKDCGTKRSYDTFTCYNGGTPQGTMRICSCAPGWTGQNCQVRAYDCQSAYDEHIHEEGSTYQQYIWPMYSSTPFKIKCLENYGGCNIFQKRQNATYPDSPTDFDRNWDAYTNGFSQGEFMGTENLYQLTVKSIYRYKLRLEINLNNSTQGLFTYYDFKVGDSSTNYELDYGKVDLPTIFGEAFRPLGNPSESVKWESFSTYDHDPKGNGCAKKYKAGWWYRNCTASNLNSPFIGEPPALINWGTMPQDYQDVGIRSTVACLIRY